MMNTHRSSARLPENRAALSPAQARALFRDGLAVPTAGFSLGYAQANLIIVPKDQAFDVLLFAQRNPKSCPILGVLDAGETSGELLAGGDIRTDVPKYVVYENGVKVAEPTDLTEYWRDDLVTFIVGCSFTFETALMEGGIRIAHIEPGRERADVQDEHPQCLGRLHVRTHGGLDAPDPRLPGGRRRAHHLPLPGGPRGPGAHRQPGGTGHHGSVQARTSATRWTSRPATSRCSGPAGSPRRRRSWSQSRRWPSATRRGTCSSPTHATATTWFPRNPR